MPVKKPVSIPTAMILHDFLIAVAAFVAVLLSSGDKVTPAIVAAAVTAAVKAVLRTVLPGEASPDSNSP